MRAYSPPHVKWLIKLIMLVLTLDWVCWMKKDEELDQNLGAWSLI